MSESLGSYKEAANVGTNVMENDLPMPSSRSSIDFNQHGNYHQGNAKSYTISFSKKAIILPNPQSSLMKANPIVTSLMRS